jgi:hypothetical protein
MEKSEYILDKEAADLFKNLQGIDANYAKDRLAEGLGKVKKQDDQRRNLLVKLVHQLGGYLVDVSMYQNSLIEEETIRQIGDTLDDIHKITPGQRNILIRFCGSPDDPDTLKKNDYEVIYGNIRVDSGLISELTERRAEGKTQLVKQLNQAFSTFYNLDIFSMYIKIPTASPKQRDRFDNTLRALARFKPAVDSNGPIEFYSSEGRQVAYPLINNEDGNPDRALTLLAVANRLKPQVISALVERIAQSPLRSRYLNSYNAIFSVKKLKERLVRPSVEVNNVLWLMADSEQEPVTPEKAEVCQFAIKCASDSPHKAAKVLKSVYGNDYGKIDSKDLGERLHLSSDFLISVEKTPEHRRMEKEILSSIELRLEEVHANVFDDLFTRKESDSSESKLGILTTLHKKIVNTVVFYKKKIDIKRKMRALVNRAINLKLQELKILAKDFDISIEEARNLIDMLKECFDHQGRFIRGSFARLIPEFTRYERSIFEFLWHYLKEYIHQKDRASYLNALELLITKMRNPKKAVKILLDDFARNPKTITYSDSKALMLCNLLIRKYHKELINAEITPEDVLQVEEGLDRGVARYVTRMIDKEQDSFFDKIRTIHKRLNKMLNSDKKDTTASPLPFLFFLEREAYIFFSLVGGTTARSVVLSAIKDYGDPSSALYQGEETKKHFNLILQNLRIVIRGLGLIGEREDLMALDEVEGSIEDIAETVYPDRNKTQVRRLMGFIQESKAQIVQRG